MAKISLIFRVSFYLLQVVLVIQQTQLSATPAAPPLVNDPAFSQQWNFHNTGQKRTTGQPGTPGADIDIMRAWGQTTGSPEVIVAIIDSGVDYNHPDLQPNLWKNPGETGLDLFGRDKAHNGVDDDNNGYTDDVYGYDFANNDADPMDTYGHGTHIAGIIGAKGNNGIGMAGINWDVKLMILKWHNKGDENSYDPIIEAIHYAVEKGAKIINCSWGTDDDEEFFGGSYVNPLYEAMQWAETHGVLIVTTAGNDGVTNDYGGYYPANYRLPNMISVAAVNNQGVLYTYQNSNPDKRLLGSNFGKNSVDLAAPGFEVLSYTHEGLELMTGTSMAVPHVTGIAALILSIDPTLDAVQLKQRIIRGAKPYRHLRKKLIKGAIANAYYAVMDQEAPLDLADPFNWLQLPVTVASPHPYPKNWHQQIKLSVAGAAKLSVHFKRVTLGQGDKIEIQSTSGEVLETLGGRIRDHQSTNIVGNAVVIRFSSDAVESRYGFEIDQIAAFPLDPQTTADDLILQIE